jgi:BMFP domain-containing protein YqiC
MHADPFTTLLRPIMQLLDNALPENLAGSAKAEIETKAQSVFKQMALVPKHEFEAQEALLQTLEAQVKTLERRLSQLEKSSDHGSPPDGRTAEN